MYRDVTSNWLISAQYRSNALVESTYLLYFIVTVKNWHGDCIDIGYKNNNSPNKNNNCLPVVVQRNNKNNKAACFFPILPYVHFQLYPSHGSKPEDAFEFIITGLNIMQIPKLAQLIDLAIQHGNINWFTGSRPTADSPHTGFGQPLWLNGHRHPVYHAFGYGGAGITLSQGVAQQVVDDFSRSHRDKQSNILIIGAGITGLSIARALLNEGYQQLTMLSAFYPPGTEHFSDSSVSVSRAHYYPSCVGGGYIMPVKFGTLVPSAQTISMIENSQHGWETLAKDPSYSAMIMMGSRVSLLPVSPDQVKNYPYDAMVINKLLGYELYPVQIHKEGLTGMSMQEQPFKRTASSVIEIHNTLMVDPASIQLQFMKELSDSRRVAFIQKTIHSPSCLKKHLQSDQIIVNASGTGIGHVFGITGTTPVRGDLIVATIPLCHLKNARPDHHSFYTPGMTLHQRFNSDNMMIVLGGTNIVGDSSTHFNRQSVGNILRHWYGFSHCPDHFHNLHKNSQPSFPEKKCKSCDADSNAFIEKVIDSLPDTL